MDEAPLAFSEVFQIFLLLFVTPWAPLASPISLGPSLPHFGIGNDPLASGVSPPAYLAAVTLQIFSWLPHLPLASSPHSGMDKGSSLIILMF